MTYRYGPVVAGFDGSAHSLGALRWAADEAHRCTRMLRLVTVLPDDAAETPAQDSARQAAEEAQRWQVGVAAVAEILHGTPEDVLRELARDARLVVVGGQGADAAEDRPTGSVSRALAARADAPVLVVHAADRWAGPEATLPWAAPVVTGFDGSDSGRRALRLAFEEAAARSVRLVVVQAWAHPDLWRPGVLRGSDLSAHERVVHEALREAAARWHAEFPMVDVEVRSEPGDAVRALTVASQWAGLMVVGTRCPADRVQPDSPSVAGRVLQHAACPVLVAHGPAVAAAPRVAHAT